MQRNLLRHVYHDVGKGVEAVVRSQEDCGGGSDDKIGQPSVTGILGFFLEKDLSLNQPQKM